MAQPWLFILPSALPSRLQPCTTAGLPWLMRPQGSRRRPLLLCTSMQKCTDTRGLPGALHRTVAQSCNSVTSSAGGT